MGNALQRIDIGMSGFVVRVYDYVDSQVLILAQMYARRLKGYGAVGYRIGAAAAGEPSPSD